MTSSNTPPRNTARQPRSQAGTGTRKPSKDPTKPQKPAPASSKPASAFQINRPISRQKGRLLPPDPPIPDDHPPIALKSLQEAQEHAAKSPLRPPSRQHIDTKEMKDPARQLYTKALDTAHNHELVRILTEARYTPNQQAAFLGISNEEYAGTFANTFHSTVFPSARDLETCAKLARAGLSKAAVMRFFQIERSTFTQHLEETYDTGALMLNIRAGENIADAIENGDLDITKWYTQRRGINTGMDYRQEDITTTEDASTDIEIDLGSTLIQATLNRK